MYPYSNYNQQQDSRYFSNPQFPEPKSSNSWFGWLIFAIGTGLAGFLLGQRTAPKTEEKEDNPFDLANSQNQSPPENEKPTQTSDDKTEEKVTNKLVRLEELTDEMVNNYIDNVNGHEYNLAEQLWYKQQMRNNPELIKKFPKLAQFLGFTN